MEIHIMQQEVSFFHILDGWCARSILMLKRKAQQLTWVIWNLIQSLCFNIGNIEHKWNIQHNFTLIYYFRNYMILMPIFCFLLPTIIPMFFWGETFKASWYVASIFRYTVSLNVTWLINSAAHIWGMKPFDK